MMEGYKVEIVFKINKAVDFRLMLINNSTHQQNGFGLLHEFASPAPSKSGGVVYIDQYLQQPIMKKNSWTDMNYGLIILSRNKGLLISLILS